MATQQSIKTAADGSGLDVEVLTVPGNLQRQTFAQGDPDDNVWAKVRNSDPLLSSYGGVVRPAVDPNTLHALLAANSTNATVVLNAPARLFHAHIFNAYTSILFLKFHNMTTTPTAGSSAVFFPVPCQAGIWTHIDSVNGISFSTGLAYTTVTGIAANDANAVPANSLVIIIERKTNA